MIEQLSRFLTRRGTRMPSPRRLILLLFVMVFLIVFLFFTKVGSQSVTELNNNEVANWIMQRVVEKSIENERIKRQYITYDKYQITEDLTKQPPKKKKETFNIYGENGQSMERRVEEDGKSVRDKGKPSNLDFTATLANKYLPRMTFRKIEEQLIDGRGYFVITFEPKAPPDQLPSKDLYDRGINRSAGILYVDMEKFYIRRFESRITEGFSAYILGQAEDFQLYVEQEERFGVIVPKQVTYIIKYSFLWINRHEQKSSTYGNHRDLRNPAVQ